MSCIFLFCCGMFDEIVLLDLPSLVGSVIFTLIWFGLLYLFAGSPSFTSFSWSYLLA